MQKTRNIKSPLPKIIGILVIAGALIVAGVWLSRTTSLFTSAPKSNFPKTPTKGGGSVTINKGSSSSTSNPNGQPAAGSQNSNPVNKTPGDNTSNAYLIAPWGDFVSNHHPGQNGSPLSETSVCNTTQGASCYIAFTNGSIVKTLPVQTADSNGATFWSNWTPSSIGLTPGNWKITATATLDGQTKSTTDPMDLVIS